MPYLGNGLTKFTTADDLTVSGDAAIDTTTLVVDSTNNRVGIGNASPSDALHIKTTADADIGLQVQNDDTQAFCKVQSGGTALYGGNGGVNFVSGGSFATRMHIASGGNVGIGTTAPAHNVEIVATAAGSVNDSLQIRNNATSSGTGSRIRFINSTDANSDANGASISSVRNGDDNDLVFETENTERVRIDHAGVAVFSHSVGIGTSIPDSSLTIATSSSGEFNALSIRQANNTSGNESRITFTRTTDAGSDREVAAIVADREGGNDTALVFETNTDGSDGSTERVRIDNQGRVSITPDGTAVYGNAAADNLTIYQTGADVGITIRSDTNRPGSLFFADGTTGNQNYRGYLQYAHNDDKFYLVSEGDLILYAGGAERMKLLSGGNVDISAGHILLDSGYGIDFSATGDSSGTTTSEILDDYEEGTWLPFLGSNETFTQRYGEYTKVGNVVHAQFRISINQINNGSTYVIYGLPYAAASNSRPQSGYVSYSSTSATNNYWVGLYVISGQAYMYVVGKTTLGASVYNGMPFFGNGADLMGGISYVVS